MAKICFVCGNPIRENPLYIGKGIYRHSQNCAPLTKKYAEYQEQKKKYTSPDGGEVQGAVINTKKKGQ